MYITTLIYKLSSMETRRKCAVI